MSKKIGLLAAATAAAIFSMGAAQAAPHNWTGVYVGGTAGATSFQTETADYWCWYACDAPGDSDIKGAVGFTAGYNWQLSNNFVVGIETDISSGAKSSEQINWSATNGVNWRSEWNWLATVRGRAGLAVDRTLVYVTGGVALADAKYRAQEVSASTNPDTASFSGRLAGLAVGVGVEHALSNNMSFKAEYMNVTMPKKSACWANAAGTCYDTGAQNDDSVHWTSSANIFRVGMNWKF